MEIGFEIIQPLREHAEIILPWINDKETLNQSYHKTPRKPEEFFEEFLSRYFTDPEFPPVFILFEGERAGYLRFKEVEDPRKRGLGSLEISICIDPEKRGKGIATKALVQIQAILKNRGSRSLVAEVKKGNAPSLKAFLAAGFKQHSQGVKKLFDTEEKVDIITLVKDLAEEKENKVFIIAEAGSNWRMGTKKRDRAMAMALIDAAKAAGVDAVKFQTYRPETIYVRNAGASHYLADVGILEDMNTIFEDLAMPYEMLKDLSEYANSISIEFMSTPFSEQDFKEVDPYVKRHKIASYENGHLHLIELAAVSGKPVFLSTGATTVEELEWAVSYFLKRGGKDLTLLHCTAKYPADPKSMNLSALPFLKKRFRLPVGLSDHSRDPIAAPIMATALGATVIEKHFTLSNSLPGPDHSFAILPHELKEMVLKVREAEKMRGEGYKSVLEEEEELRSFSKRGLQAIHVIEEGDVYKEGANFGILRPGNQTQGAHPRFLPEVEGKKAKRKIAAGSGIVLGDW